MKRKVFLMSLMIMALVCVLAISAFAEDIIVSKTESDEYGTVIQLNADPGLDNAERYVSTLKKINDTGVSTQDYSVVTDGEYYYVFPSSYIVWELEDGKFEIYAGTAEQPGLAQAMAEFNLAMGTSYYSDYTIVGSGASRRLEALVRFEFPSDVTYAHSDHCCIRAYPRLLEVRINHPFDISKGKQLFYNCKKLETVIGFETVSGSMPTSVFQSCANLGFVKLPTNMTKIPNSMFQSCNSGNLNIANLLELTQLTTIGSWAFDGCQRLTITLPDSVTTLNSSAFGSAFKYAGAITISPNSQLKTIGESAFSDCGKLAGIYIPSTVTSIGKNAFKGCSSLTKLENLENCQITKLAAGTFSNVSAIESITLPKTVTTIEAAFSNNNALKLVYIPSTVTSIADTFTGTQPADAVYFYVSSDDTTVFEGCARLKDANIILANNYNSTATYTGINLVVDYSDCVVYNKGVHPDCTSDTVVTSFLEDIKVVSRCNLCGLYDENGKIDALFVCLGYSASENGDSGIVIGYTVNKTAINTYKEIANVSLNYGVFAISQDKLGDKDVFTDGSLVSGAISFDVTSYEYSAFVLKIVGFTDAQKDVKLAMGAYVAVNDGETTTYSYLQDDEKGTLDGKYYFVSYNDIVPPQEA